MRAVRVTLRTGAAVGITSSSALLQQSNASQTETLKQADSASKGSVQALTPPLSHAQPFQKEECSLLGYPIRRAAAFELLYGGARVRHLVQPVFPLQRIPSELLPSPSAERERNDLNLEMQMPRHKDPTQVTAIEVQHQIDGTLDAPKESRHDGFDMGQYFNDVFHPALHHNSSHPYDPVHNTNNVLALRLFPINIGIRHRTESIRLRTKDCLERLRHRKLVERLGLPLQYPLPLSVQKVLKDRIETCESMHRPRSLCSGSVNPMRPHTPATLPSPSSSNTKGTNNLASLLPHVPGKLRFHPSPESLSLFTRPQDTPSLVPSESTAPKISWNAILGRKSSSWMPFQMLKPVGHNWSPGRRSSGTRGRTAQLHQERLDRKGFGYKRKSRSLWQQDIHTSGFRPNRYF